MIVRLFAALTLAVLVYAPADTAPKVRERVVDSLRRHGAEVVEHTVETARASRRAGWRLAAELSFFTEGARLMEHARAAKEQVELEAALAGYAEAESLYEAHLAAPGTAALAAEAGLERGTVLVELGRVAEARTVFQHALDLWPELTLTERHARPDVVRLFKEVARAPRTALTKPEEVDAVVARLGPLERTPTTDGLAALLSALPVEATLVVAVGSDSTHALAIRVEANGATQPAPFSLEQLDDAVQALLARPLADAAAALSLTDPRLRPTPTVAAIDLVAPSAKPRHKRVWPWVVAGAAVVGATIIGVTIGLIATDARYSVKVSGSSFAP